MAPTTQRRFWVGGNWKMNGSTELNRDLVGTLSNVDTSAAEVVVFPPALYAAAVRSSISPQIGVGVQNCYHETKGAFTGEISPAMVKDIGCEWTLQGHSERRSYFSESDDYVAHKTRFALDAGLKVVPCLGETLEQRQKGETMDVLIRQLGAIVQGVRNARGGDAWDRVVIAYEPVWAIGTGVVATAEQAEEVHGALRKWVEEHVSAEIASALRIVYGGSVNAKNCKDLAKKPNVDGFLVGGASLKPEFVDIVKAQA